MAELLKVRIDDLSREEARKKVEHFLHSGENHSIFTPNPEMIVLATRDHAFRDILNASDLNICDGKGTHIYSGVKERIPGSDFVSDVCDIAMKEKKSVYFLGSGSDEVLQKTREVLLTKFPHLEIVGWNKGPMLNKKGEGDSELVIDDIIRRAPDILFVAFGHGKQEYWINNHLHEFPSVRVAMGVGGAFDFISGNIRRAPQWMKSLGLEWLWRLILQPRRIGRIFTALIIFPYLCSRSR